ncbi:MAG: nucleoside deaminase [Oscillospiraceae bacterium]|nr:nucleoside deaminase [Oscillospiraceae bacterium]
MQTAVSKNNPVDNAWKEAFMSQALSLAEKAADKGEVPVGCIITDSEGNIIARGSNRSRETMDATAHAEIEAIREASKVIGDWHLDGCTIYVTLEPCPMCVGAIMNSRIRRVIYGAKDPVKGACGSVIDLFSEHFPDKAVVYGNVLGKESGELLSTFFSSVREEKYN